MTYATEGIRFGRVAAMLPVKDILKAHDFYTKVFGFTKTFENGDPVGFMILERDSAEASHLATDAQGRSIQHRPYDGGRRRCTLRRLSAARTTHHQAPPRQGLWVASLRVRGPRR